MGVFRYKNRNDAKPSKEDREGGVQGVSEEVKQNAKDEGSEENSLGSLFGNSKKDKGGE